jgi:hypothetical protein
VGRAVPTDGLVHGPPLAFAVHLAQPGADFQLDPRTNNRADAAAAYTDTDRHAYAHTHTHAHAHPNRNAHARTDADSYC